MAAEANPFAALSLIVAPAILTNACSVLIMSTGNRLGRAVDRARELSRELEGTDGAVDAVAERRLRELRSAEARALLLLRAMRGCYVALSGFASAALVSLLGAVLFPIGQEFASGHVTRMLALTDALESLGILAGVIAVGALIYASVLLVRDTRIAVEVLQERAANLQARAQQRMKAAN